jgi:dihydrolipoamide dehydrogenase
MSDPSQYDLIIIGAGPGGYVAAIRSRQLGLKTAVIEKDRLGGVCLNIGCIPSKSLIHQADLYRSIPQLEYMGLNVDTSAFDYAQVFKKSREAADTLSRGIAYLFKKNDIPVIRGTAKLSGPNTVSVNNETYLAQNIVIASGSRPRKLPGFAFDGKHVLSSSDALMLERLPARALIIGSGAIGIEFAHVWNAFGVEVHVVEILDRILPMEDEETAKVIRQSFKKRGITFYVGTRASQLAEEKGSLNVSLESERKKPKTLSVDAVMVAVGRSANTEELGLEQLGIQTDNGFIVTGDYYETTMPGTYAIGDVKGPPLLAHTASAEGELVIEHIAGMDTPKRIDPETIPSAVYSEPQIGSFGYTEQRVREDGIEYKKAVFPYRGVGKSVAVEKSEGLVKIIYSPETHEILGAHIAGAEATELIHELLLAKTAELLPEDIIEMIHAHPTLSEAIKEAALTTEERAIHS